MVLCLGLSGLSFRVAWLQVFQSDLLEARARNVQTEKNSPLGTRRSILDRQGKLIAIDEKRFKIWAHPRYFNLPGHLKTKRLLRLAAQVEKQALWQI